jgi:hypothetical protein
MRKQLITPATQPVIDLASAKTIGNFHSTNRDDEFADLLGSAVEFVEGYTGITLKDTVWDVWIDVNDFNSLYQYKGYFDLVTLNAHTITALHKYSSDGTETLIPADEYDVLGGRLTFRDGADLSNLRCLDSLKVRCTSGFVDLDNDNAEDVPQDITLCVIHLALYWFKRKAMKVELSEMPLGVVSTLNRYRKDISAVI